VVAGSETGDCACVGFDLHSSMCFIRVSGGLYGISQ
jgi:hypothetical protein